jgi:hypothetical protein
MIEQSVRPARRWPAWAIPLLVVAIAAGAAMWIWSTTTSRTNTAPAAALPAGAMQTDERGQVTIGATWQGSGAPTVFNITQPYF